MEPNDEPSYFGLVKRTLDLGDLMCTAARLPLFTTVAVVSPDRSILAIDKDWAGGKPNRDSKAPAIGPAKALELRVNLEGDFVTTPTGDPMGTGYMGGVRRREEYGVESSVHFITSCSASSERCDAMLAIVLNYAMSWETRLHHVGYRHADRKVALETVAEREAAIGATAVFMPTLEHDRWYIPVRTAHLAGRTSHGVFWEEHQWWWDSGMQNYAMHLDVATLNGRHLLHLLQEGLITAALHWDDATPVEPIGAMWQEDDKGVPLGIFVREQWWNLPRA